VAPAHDAGALVGLAQPRDRKRPDLRDAKIAALERERQQLERELAKARFVMDVQAKLQELLEKLSESEDTEPK
jgi:transposase